MKRKQIQSRFDITIGQYQKIQSIKDITATQLISIVYDIPHEIVLELPEKQIATEAEQIQKVFNQKPSFISRYKGLGFEPDLDNMTAGAFADAYEYSKNESQLHLFTAVLYRPIIKRWFHIGKQKKYNIQPYNGALEREAEAKEMPLALLLSAQGFFFDLRKSFLNVIQHRLQEKSKHLKVSQNKEGSTVIGDGVYDFMQFLEETISRLTKLPESRLQKLCIT